ncbi:iron-sulfur cluster assembly scaffold protein [Novosphingobium sp. ZN18A2]|uniref:iron-sulfur cluster assembly scaffold protein n=1 Tax=Novosphingobium sp. ZN18A2 TaxID=3079861 RepID=UPI0030CB4A9A
MSAKGLYTPEILAAATGLSAWPWDEGLPLRGNARSRSCGSSIALALGTDDAGAIRAIGIRPHACAVGQAAAQVFARSATGKAADDLKQARQQIAAWLAGDPAAPDWPGISLLDNARAYPARHAAILLAWDAAIDALENRQE